MNTVTSSFSNLDRACIYLLVHIPTGKRYVGQSINSARGRCDWHVRHMCERRHPSNRYLPPDLVPEQFTWSVIDIVPRYLADDAEAYWAEHHRCHGPEGLNTAQIVGDPTRYARLLHMLEQRRLHGRSSCSDFDAVAAARREEWSRRLRVPRRGRRPPHVAGRPGWLPRDA